MDSSEECAFERTTDGINEITEWLEVRVGKVNSSTKGNNGSNHKNNWVGVHGGIKCPLNTSPDLGQRLDNSTFFVPCHQCLDALAKLLYNTRLNDSTEAH